MIDGIVPMSKKELKQIAIFERLARKEITQKEAAIQLSLGERQVCRKLKKFVVDGPVSLAHGNRGKPSPKKLSDEKRKIIVALLIEQYYDFGPTFATEKLRNQHGIISNRTTIRNIMVQEGLWTKKEKKEKHRSWRPPKNYFGQLAQCDGSIHDWFENRAPRCTLVKFVDDATGKILGATFGESESYNLVAQATMDYFKKHGIPRTIYVDRGKVFKVNVNNDNDEFTTQYQNALKKLDVGLIHAYSPQAKGRIERSFQTDQDRLVKELRLRKISSIAEANKFLQNEYIPAYNKQFSRPALLPDDLHRSIDDVKLEDVFVIEEERVVHNDWTIQYYGQILQIHDNNAAVVRPKERVTVSMRLDKSLFLAIRTIGINFSVVTKRPVKEDVSINHKPFRKPYVPPTDHPWRRSNSMFFK